MSSRLQAGLGSGVAGGAGPGPPAPQAISKLARHSSRGTRAAGKCPPQPSKVLGAALVPQLIVCLWGAARLLCNLPCGPGPESLIYGFMDRV